MRVWIYILLFVMLVVLPGTVGAQNCSYTGTGDWVVNTTDICLNETITLNGNLTIESGGNLTLENVTLNVNAASDGGVVIDNQGSLQILDSEINSSSGFAYLFWTNPGANFLLKDSYLHKVGFSSSNLKENGLYILSNDSEISGSTITDSYFGVVFKETSNCIVSNSVFASNQLYDLFLMSSENIGITNTNYTTMIKKWYLDISVVDSNGSGVGGANVVVADAYSNEIYDGGSLSDGSIPRLIVKEIFENKAGSDEIYNPYTINVTKTNYYSNTSSVNVTGDLSKEILIKPVNVSDLVITVKSPVNNSVYLKNDLVNYTLLLLEVETSINASSCDYMLDSTLIGSLSSTDQRNFRGYANVYDSLYGESVVTFLCQSGTTEKTSKAMFSVYPERECLSDLYCEDDEECASNFMCVELSCVCGYPSNHDCVDYECCADSECEDDEVCDISEHVCKDVQCGCGVVRDHSCVFPYPGYCCENTHCDENQTCDVINHRCITQVLHVYVPERIVQGESIDVYVKDQNNMSVSGASITVTYSDSGNMYFFSVDSQGIANILVNESGKVQISARKSKYFTAFASVKVSPAFDWLLFSVIFVVVSLAIVIPVLLFKKRELFKFGGPLKLEKTASGGIVMLRVRNKTSGTLKLLNIVDSVPRGGFIRCNLMPKIETIDQTTDRLVWTLLELDPKEEVVIEYEARGFYKGFSVEFGGKRYKG